MKRVWSDEAWDGYVYWQNQGDKRTLKKINALIKDIERDGHGGLGHPHALSGNLAGFWSREINEKDRLVYRVKGGMVEIISCKGHYGDK